MYFNYEILNTPQFLFPEKIKDGWYAKQVNDPEVRATDSYF